VLDLEDSNKVIISGLSSKMAVYREAGKTYVATHKLATNEYLIFDDLPNTNNTISMIGTNYGSNTGGLNDNGFFKFSPSGKYLVSSSFNPHDIFQIKISPTELLATGPIGIASFPIMSMQLAPDGKIYVAQTASLTNYVKLCFKRHTTFISVELF